MAENKLNLLADFPEVTREQWMEKIQADLKGADFEKKLVWKTNEGFNVMPFYIADDITDLKTSEVTPGKFPYVRGTKVDNSWYIRQEILVIDPKTANNKALDILNKGVDSINFVIRKNDVTSTFISTLLENIAADCVELNFCVGYQQSANFLKLLTAYFNEKTYDFKKLHGSVNWDGINSMLLCGDDFTKQELVNFAKETFDAATDLPFYRVIGVNALTLTNAGAFISTELGYALAWGNEYLSSLIDAGCEPSVVAKKIKFNFGVGNNYFMEIAKFRAARLLWAKIVDAYQPRCLKTNCKHTVNDICKCAAKMRVHAETTIFNKTVFDPNVNMLRTQTEAMSAVLGGVNSLTVLPFDVAYKTSGEFSERIARNQQLLLKEESHFDKVADPAAGSYYIETLTNKIAEQAWKIFIEIEENGGYFEAVKSGTVQKTIKTMAVSRLKAVSARREILLGTNQFPNFNEIAETPQQNIREHACSSDAKIETLPPLRAAQEFEELRFSTQNAAKRPVAFMLTIGNLAMRLARAQFSCNFFACAGYEVIDNLGFKTIEEGVAAAEKSGADIIVLCSSDDEYAELAPAAFNASKGKAILVVAGAPACMDELKNQGIEHFINVKSNVLETLRSFNKLLGI
jgi:methylmalonyl-CoA mutase